MTFTRFGIVYDLLLADSPNNKYDENYKNYKALRELFVVLRQQESYLCVSFKRRSYA